MLRHSPTRIALLMLALVCTGCASPMRDTGRYAHAPIAEPLVAVDAFLDDDFYVVYQQAGKTIYSGGAWSHRVSLDDAERLRSTAFVLPLEYHRLQPWAERPADARSGAILSRDAWVAFRTRLLEAALPPPGSGGLVLELEGVDYVLYTSADGGFRADRLVDKPAGVPVIRRLEFSALLEVGLPLLERFLEERGVDERRVLFNTGDTGPWSLPFLYVNRDLPIAVFLRYPELPPVGAMGGRIPGMLGTLRRFVQSHTTGVALRPVSSVLRLLLVTTDTVQTGLGSLPRSSPGEPVPLRDAPGMDLALWEAHLTQLTGRKPTSGTLDYLVDGEAFFTRLADVISQASESVDLRTYIYDNDDFATRFGELLKRRSNEGIDVRMLFDGLGTVIATAEQQSTLPKDWRGPASVRRFLVSDSNVRVRHAPNPWLTGDHVKTIVVDQQIAFTGGMNIAREYRYDWHDLMIEVRGPVVGILDHEFQRAWSHAGPFGDIGWLWHGLSQRQRSAAADGYPIRVLFTRPGVREIFRARGMPSAAHSGSSSSRTPTSRTMPCSTNSSPRASAASTCA